MKLKHIDIDVEGIPELQNTGFPSFQEFCKNPDKYRKKKDEAFNAVDQAGSTIKPLITKQTYEIFGYKCDNLEKVEKIASDHGYSIDQLAFRPYLKPVPGGSGSQPKCEVHTIFEPQQKQNSPIWMPK